MTFPQLTVRTITKSPLIERHIKKQLSKINRIYQKINSCHIGINTEQNHHLKGKLFSISIDLSVPGREITTKKANRNLYLAIKNGFVAVEKILKKNCKKKFGMKAKKRISAMSFLANEQIA